MSISSAESDLRIKAARVMRAARKQAGMTQVELAATLEISQSAISKIEAGVLAPPLLVWMTFCRLLNVDAIDALDTGYVDRLCPLSGEEKRAESGRFHLPSAYRDNNGSSVRAALPFLRVFGNEHGDESLAELISAMKFDPDYFVILDQPVNLRFTLDVARKLIELGDLDPKRPERVAGLAREAIVHGRLHQAYDQARTQRELLLRYFSNIDKYDVDFEYGVQEDAKLLRVSVAPREHLRRIEYRDTSLGAFLCDYRKSYLKAFSRYRGDESAALDESECHFRGAERCVYSIRV